VRFGDLPAAWATGAFRQRHSWHVQGALNWKRGGWHL
jgi:hypothetical protein